MREADHQQDEEFHSTPQEAPEPYAVTDVFAIIESSSILRSVVDSKRGHLVSILKSEQYASALKDSRIDDVHRLVLAVLHNSHGSSLKAGETLKRFDRLVKFQRFLNPDPEIAMRDSKTFRISEWEYSIPQSLNLQNLDSNSVERDQLLHLLKGILEVLRTARYLRALMTKSLPKRDEREKKKKALEDCEMKLGKYPFLKEKGFEVVLMGWGIQLSLYPAKLLKRVNKLSSCSGLDGHIKRLLALQMCLETPPESQ